MWPSRSDGGRWLQCSSRSGLLGPTSTARSPAPAVSRPWGFVVNEIGDRTSDLLTFAGLAVWAARRGGPGLH